MKARMLKDAIVPNPVYDTRQHLQAESKGETYPHSPQLEVSAGYIASGNLAWSLCVPGMMNADPVAEPVDQDCMAAVKAWMTKNRPEILENYQAQLDNLEHIKDKAAKALILRRAKAYGLATESDAARAEAAAEAEAKPAKK